MLPLARFKFDLGEEKGVSLSSDYYTGNKQDFFLPLQAPVFLSGHGGNNTWAKPRVELVWKCRVSSGTAGGISQPTSPITEPLESDYCITLPPCSTLVIVQQHTHARTHPERYLPCCTLLVFSLVFIINNLFLQRSHPEQHHPNLSGNSPREQRRRGALRPGTMLITFVSMAFHLPSTPR